MINEIAYIYVLTSPSGKKYVGQTVNINKRFENYRNLRRTSQIKLAKAIVKYGWDNFTKEIYEYKNISNEALNYIEIRNIHEYDSFNNGYNCTLGGGGRRIHKTIEERKYSRKLVSKKYRENNYDRIKILSRMSYLKEDVKERRKEKSKLYYQLNKEKINKRNKEYILNNKEAHLKRRRKYYLKNKEIENERCRKYYRKRKDLENED